MTAFIWPGRRVSDGRQTSRLGRLRARLHSRRLDRELAAGTDPDDSPELQQRAAELVGAKGRCHLAVVLDRIRREAEGPVPPFGSLAPLARVAIRANAPLIKTIVARLEGGRSLMPAGVARVAVLVHEDGSPLFSPEISESDLRQALTSILGQLDAA